jgi:hypothetical protein
VDPVAQSADHQPVEAAEIPELGGDRSPMENIIAGNLEPSAAAEVDAEVRPYSPGKGEFARTSGLATVARVSRAREGYLWVFVRFK